MSSFKFLFALLKAVRPRQWIKNFALFAGLIFSGQLDNPISVISVIQAFFIFCGATSAIYLLNDVFDVERDRKHPFKKLRPIAAGVIAIPIAVILSVLLIITVIPLAFVLSPAFFLALVSYLILQIFYSAYLKTIILLDVMAIAAGFVLRIYAGVWVIDAHLNIWFFLTVTSFALFLAIGKRRSELTLLQAQASSTRETLSHYPATLLDVMTAMFANSTWLAYAIFTFFQPPIYARTTVTQILTNISLNVSEAKYLMVTIPIVIYGVMRYLYIIYEKKEGESPERVLLTDRPLLITVVMWVVTLIILIYYWGK